MHSGKDAVKQWHRYNRIELWLRLSSQAMSGCFGRTPGNHSRNPWQPLAEPLATTRGTPVENTGITSQPTTVIYVSSDQWCLVSLIDIFTGTMWLVTT